MPTSSRVTRSYKGNFWIHYPDHPRQGPEPDGDTVSFAADDLALVRSLHWHSGHGPNINARAASSPVRYEGIDALGDSFQGRTPADAICSRAPATKTCASWDSRNVVFFPDLPNKVSSVDVNPLRGYVLANGIEANGRPRDLSMPVTPPMADGSQPFVDEAMLGQSVNAKLVAAGLAYVEPYDSMPIALVVRHLRTIIATARQAQYGPPGHGERQQDPNRTGAGSRNAADPWIMWLEAVPPPHRLFCGSASMVSASLTTGCASTRSTETICCGFRMAELGNMHDTYRVVGDTMTLAYNPEELPHRARPQPRWGAMSALMTPAFLASRACEARARHSSSGGRSIIQPICHLWLFTLALANQMIGEAGGK